MDGEREILDLFQLVEISGEINRRLDDLPEGGVLVIEMIIGPKPGLSVGHPCHFPVAKIPIELKKEDKPQKAIKAIKEEFSPQTSQLTVVI